MIVNKRNRRIFTGLMMTLLFVLAGCGGTGNGDPLEILDSPAAQNGVTVTLDTASVYREETPSRYVYTLGGTIENTSEEPIMQVVYSFAFYTKEGEEFRSFDLTYDGEDRALTPGEKYEFFRDDIVWGAQDIPASVRIGVGEVQTEAELPAAHVPQAGEYVYQALDNEKLAAIREEPPQTMYFHVDQGGYGQTATLNEGAALDEAVELFCEIKIAAEADEWVTDNYNYIGFEWADGSAAYIRLNLRNLEYAVHSTPHTYELDGLDEFWSYASGFLVEDEYEVVQDS